MSQVRLEGKLTKVQRVSYSPSGVPVLELELAFRQELLGKASTGYIRLLCSGRLAEEISPQARVGKLVSLTGTLWSRRFKSREGSQVEETKVIVDAMDWPSRLGS